MATKSTRAARKRAAKQAKAQHRQEQMKHPSGMSRYAKKPHDGSKWVENGPSEAAKAVIDVERRLYGPPRSLYIRWNSTSPW